MKKLAWLFIVFGVLSCDDGDVDVPEFNFSSDDIENCGELLLYTINETEVLAIDLSNTKNEDNSFFLQERTNELFSLTENGTNTISYRTYDAVPPANYFCQNVPPSSPSVLSEWIGTGNLFVTTTLSIDDNDGIANENEDINGNDDLEDDDSDGDTIPDYKDFDDDNDGIKTINEDIDGDGSPLNDDTDNDDIPNYLDKDDDNDGVDTAFESTTEDDDGDELVNYLDADFSPSLPEARTLTNRYTKSYRSIFTIDLLELTNAINESINFDIYEFADIIRTNDVDGIPETKKK